MTKKYKHGYVCSMNKKKYVDDFFCNYNCKSCFHWPKLSNKEDLQQLLKCLVIDHLKKEAYGFKQKLREEHQGMQ